MSVAREQRNRSADAVKAPEQPRPAGGDVESPPVSLAGLSAAELTAMRAAGREIRECYRVLRKARLNVVGEVLRGHGTFYEDDHYPPGDVYDADTGSQYYYHAHRGIGREHGHFHTFLRGRGLRAADGSGSGAARGDASGPAKGRLIHLVGISMDPWGYPMGLFAVNRWVTGETWLPAREIEPLLGNFRIDHAWPSWPVNRWMSAMFVLFRPQILALLHHRDAVVEAWRSEHPNRDPGDDTGLELAGWLPISVEEQLAELERRHPQA